MKSVVEALSLLTPYDVNVPKVRLGPNTDGGYVLLDNIHPSQDIISYGIEKQYIFDERMAAAGHKVYMFDHTIDGIEKTNDNMIWVKEGVAGRDLPEENLYTIESHLARNQIIGNDLILKMDVEGAEYDALFALPEEILQRFKLITLEVHGLANLESITYRDVFLRFFEKLNLYHTLFHVHANNCDGSGGLHIVDGVPVSNLIELSYVRTVDVTRRPSQTLYPTPLDYPNIAAKDKLLWFFPFLPTSLSPEDFLSCASARDAHEPTK